MKTVRKLTPVSPYDIQSLESWLQDMAREGLYLTKYRNSFCTFTRKAPGAVRYRVEYCKPDRRGPVSPPQALIDLYQDFGWTYVCPAAGASMPIFFTDDPRAEEPHTDPPLQGELVAQMARSQRKSLLVTLACYLVLAVLIPLLPSQPLLFLIGGIHTAPVAAMLILSVPLAIRDVWDWRRTVRLARQLRDGVPMDHQVSLRSRPLRNGAGALMISAFSAWIIIAGPIYIVYSIWEINTDPPPQAETYFTPLSLSALEGEGFQPDLSRSQYGVSLDHSLLCWDQVGLDQSGWDGGGREVHLYIRWYRPLLAPLAQPLAQELLDKWQALDYRSWWTAPEETWDSWTVTEYAVDGLDWCAVAVQPGGGFQLAALSGNGRAACVQYTGSGSLSDHLEEIAGMVA